MTQARRIFSAFALSLMLVVTSLSMAVARGAPGPAGQLVICTGSGPVMINVDSEGQPTGAVHICPEAALSLIQMGFDSPDVPLTADVGVIAFVPSFASPYAVGSFGRARARAPPLRA